MGVLLLSQTIMRLLGLQRTNIGGFELDVSVVETHDNSWTVTQKPVEDGSKISDNAIQEPVKVTIEGVITNGLFSVLGVGDTFQKKEKLLHRIAEMREPIVLLTDLKTYQNMIFERIEYVRDHAKSGGLFVKIDFVQVRIIETRTAQGGTNQQVKNGNPRKSGEAVNKGNVPAVKPIQQQEQELRSVAKISRIRLGL